MVKKTLLFFALIVLALAIAAPTAGVIHNESLQNRIFQVLKATQDKVAKIEVEKPIDLPQTMGSGFLISPEGEIITNEHVVRDAERISVFFGNRQFEAKIIRQDKNLDLAILQITAQGIKFPFLQLGNSDEVQTGELVLAIGSPLGLESTVTFGIISNPERRPPPEFYAYFEKWENVQIKVQYYLQTDATINEGNSGGPLISLRTGKVIGVNSWILAGTGLNFAIPSNIVDRFVKKREIAGPAKISAREDWLQILVQELDDEVKNFFKIPAELKGLLVSKVGKNSPAKDKLRQGDLITQVNGETLESAAKFYQLILMTDADETLKLKVYRTKEKIFEEILLKK